MGRIVVEGTLRMDMLAEPSCDDPLQFRRQLSLTLLGSPKSQPRRVDCLVVRGAPGDEPRVHSLRMDNLDRRSVPLTFQDRSGVPRLIRVRHRIAPPTIAHDAQGL